LNMLLPGEQVLLVARAIHRGVMASFNYKVARTVLSGILRILRNRHLKLRRPSLSNSLRLITSIVLLAMLVASCVATHTPILKPPAAAETTVPPMPVIPGRLEGTGTHFKMNNSRYLNLTLDSSQPIKLVLESIPEMVTMHIQSASAATSTQITLSSFPPQTTFHKYEADYHNHAAFTTDLGGRYTYAQDLSKPHFVFIQPRASTIFLSDTGWSNPTVGTWNAATRTGTLTKDVTETIQIDSNGITLDGNGHTTTGTGTGNGVYLYGRTGVTIKNLIVQQFTWGILLWEVDKNTITKNTLLNNLDIGISLTHGSTSSTISQNNAMNNGLFGINVAWYSENNVVIGNSASGSFGGIGISVSNKNLVEGNYISDNLFAGLGLGDSSANVITGNSFSNNPIGIYVGNSYESNVMGNRLSNCGSIGIYIRARTGSNSFSGNTILNGGGFVVDEQSNNNKISNNTLTNTSGIVIEGVSNNNIVSENKLYASSGIALVDASNNTVRGNQISDNSCGIFLLRSSDSTITRNTLKNNVIGLRDYASRDRVYNNNFISNSTQVWIELYGGTIFSLPKPTGGNYWSNWNSPDNDGDGFVDSPLSLGGGAIDYLPWTRMNGWLDTTPPTTTISLSGTVGGGGWYLSDVTVTLTATDKPGGSGVKKTEYSFDATTWITYGATFPITVEGTTTVYYRSVDNNGNVEPTKTQAVKIDKTPPTSSATLTGTLNPTYGYYTSDVSVTITATDKAGGSGVKEIRYVLGSGSEVVVSGSTATFTVTVQGVTMVRYWAVDVAGNVEAQKTKEIKILRAVASWVPPMTVKDWYKANQTMPIKFTLKDPATNSFVHDEAVKVTVLGPGGYAKTYVFGTGDDNIRINDADQLYITNWHLTDLLQLGTYTIQVQFKGILALETQLTVKA